MRPLALFPLLALGLSPALAAETAWQDLGPDVRVRLIAGEGRTADGKTMVALELDMPATTKTYWRVPGETGIATQIDIGASAGVEGSEIVWPYPQVESKDGFTDFVYYGPTVLPIEVAVAGDSPVLGASLVLGICSDVCIPATAEFSLPLDLSAPHRGHTLRINQAVARAPVAWDGPGEPIGEVSFDPVQDGLLVAVTDATVDPASIIASTGDEDLLFGAPQKSPDGKLVLLPLLGGDASEGLVGMTVGITFMTPKGPFELSRRVVPSTPGGL